MCAGLLVKIVGLAVSLRYYCDTGMSLLDGANLML